MQKLKLDNNWYGNWYGPNGEIFERSSVSIKPGLTVLVGKNGAGKTTALQQFRSQLEANGLNVLSYDNYGINSPGNRLSDALFLPGHMDYAQKAALSSEGQNIMLALGDYAKESRTFMHKTITEGKTSIWFLMDAIDSGLSVNGIVDVKDFIMKQRQNSDPLWVGDTPPRLIPCGISRELH